MKAFSALPENIRHNAELVYMDLFPDTTRFPEKWEKTFAVYFTAQEMEKRRAIIDSLWKINSGGQAALFLQDILQAIEPEIKVIENVPVANPRLVRIVKMAVCGNAGMYCGNRTAACGAKLGSTEFVPPVLRNDVSEFYSRPYERSWWSMCFFVCKDVLRDASGKIIHNNAGGENAACREVVNGRFSERTEDQARLDQCGRLREVYGGRKK